MLKDLFLRCSLFWLSCTSAISCIAQDSLPGSYTDISRIRLFELITKTIHTAYRDKDVDFISSWPGIYFVPGIVQKGTVPNRFISRNLVLKFNLYNSSGLADSIYFFPGFYYEDIQLYKIGANYLPEPLPRLVPAIRDGTGFRLITLAPHDSATILADLTFVKTYNNTIRPRLVKAEYLEGFLSALQKNHYDVDMVTYVFCGLLLMMLLFSIANFSQGIKKDFVYYACYTLLTGIMLFTQAYYTLHTSPVAFYLESYLDFMLQGLGIVFYMLFMQRFLETRSFHPFVFKLYKTGIILVPVSLLFYTFFHYFTNNFIAENGAENIIKFYLLMLILVFLVYCIRHWNDTLLRYVFWGNLSLFIFSVISQLSILFYSTMKNLPGVLSSSVFYYELGLFFELLIFLAGLNQKNRRQLISQTRERENLRSQNLLKEYEKELAVYKAQQAERERISADMHDELGSGLTAIRLMSEIARNKMKENTPAEINKISSSADDVLNKMNAIIWSMNSGNDTLDNLVSYIRSYALEYFENTPMHCRVITPDLIPEKELAGDKRRNIFLCIKETLNNALKHSKGTAISIEISIDKSLVIRIRDNGMGIDKQQLRQFGNGLKNIARRMEIIGGTFSIENENGTITTLVLPL